VRIFGIFILEDRNDELDAAKAKHTWLVLDVESRCME
jgi:hypothetical protein